MKPFNERLSALKQHVDDGGVCIMIVGLGSVGSYLLDYILSRNDETIKVVTVGRNQDKMRVKVNIARVAALIREQCKSEIELECGVDLNDVGAIAEAIAKYQPNFIVNSSRAYPGLKYGSISWKNIRAYGIWSPLAIRFTKNIMQACNDVDTNAIVINTSYPDAVNAWLKSAGRAYPDFGSGNFNHLIPRIRYAVADILHVKDFWNVDLTFAAGHFHDVCISKEGHTENIPLLLNVRYRGQKQNIDQNDIFAKCNILMPVDATRNMMNASSNFRIIDALVSTVRDKKSRRIFPPGAFGEIGGLPVLIDCNDNALRAAIDTSDFTLEQMREVNRKSMYLDGIEKIVDDKLFYTDELIQKVRQAFDVELPKSVAYDEIEDIAQFIINRIVIPNDHRGGNYIT